MQKLYRVEIKKDDEWYRTDYFEHLSDALTCALLKPVQWRIVFNGWTMARSI